MNTKEIIYHLVEAITSSKVYEEPFHHLYVENIFPDSFYNEIELLKDQVETYKELNHEDAILEDGTVTRRVFPFNKLYLESLGEQSRKIADQLLEVFQSNELKEALFESLQIPLKRRHAVENINDLQGFPKSGLFSDLPGYSIRPHTDINTKILTFQAYLPPLNNSQLCLGTSFYRRNNFYKFINPELEWSSKVFKKTFSFVKRKILASKPEFFHEKSIPFKRNSCYAFAVDDQSWHGVEKMPYGLGDRFSLMNIYYTDENQKFYDT